MKIIKYMSFIIDEKSDLFSEFGFCGQFGIYKIENDNNYYLLDLDSSIQINNTLILIEHYRAKILDKDIENLDLIFA